MEEKLTDAPLTRIMSPEPVTVDVNTPLGQVRELMAHYGFRHLPVLRGKELAGIISQTDVMRLSFGNIFEDQEDTDMAMMDMLSTEQVMVSNPMTVGPGSTVGTVAGIFVRENYHAVPVVENREVVGIVSTTDVIRYFLENS